MFVGREADLEELSRLWRKRVASLVTCRGRRRIGKSTLIEEFARRSGARFLKLEGKAPEPGMSNNLSFHPLGDVLLQVNLMHSSLYSQDSEHSLRSRPLCVSA